MRRLLLLCLLMLLPAVVRAQSTTFTPVCAGIDDTAKFSAIIATIGANEGTILLPYKNGSRCAVNTLNVPANITLDNSSGTGLKINAGQVLTDAGPRVNPPGKTLLYGPGTWVLTGSAYAFARKSADEASPPGEALYDPGRNKPFFTRTNNNPEEILLAGSPINGANITREAKVITASTYAVLAADAGKNLVFTNGSLVAVTLAQAGSVTTPRGFYFDVTVLSGSVVTITPAVSTINSSSAVTLNSGNGLATVSNDGVNWYAVTGSSSSPAASTSIVNPKDYGLIADGTSHPLSERYSTLAAARAAYGGAYYFVTSLTQQIDYAAQKAASNAAFGPDMAPGTFITIDKTSTVNVIVDPTAAYGVNALTGKILSLRYFNGFVSQRTVASNTATTITLVSPLPFDPHCGAEVCLSICGAPAQSYDCIQYAIGTAGENGYTNKALNKPLFLPGGVYVFGDDVWLIRNAVGIHIYGAGRLSTRLTANGTVFATDGLWYSEINSFETASLTNAAGVTFDIDGNVPGQPYATRSVQGNSFHDLLIDGDEGATAFQMCRQGGAGAQCSENVLINNHFSRADILEQITGANALNNTHIGGNYQDFLIGVKLIGGSASFLKPAFQSTRGYAQITGSGADIDASTFGTGESILVDAPDSESLVLYHGSGSQTGHIRGALTRCGACQTWRASTAYTSNQITSKSSVSDGTKIYRITTPGTSGGDSVTGTCPTGCADIFSASTIGKTTKSWSVNTWAGKRATILAGTGSGQSKLIASNTATTITLTGTWGVTPDATSTFQIEPNWPNSGTIADGGAVWSTVEYNVVDAGVGQIELKANVFGTGNVLANSYADRITGSITANITLGPSEKVQFYNIDATGGNITITLPVFGKFFPLAVPYGTSFYFHRTDSSANTVTIAQDNGGHVDGAGSDPTMPGTGWVGLYLALDSGAQDNYRTISASNTLTLNGKNFASPAAIGTGTPAAGTFTALTGTSLTVTGTPVSTSSVGLAGALQVMTTGAMTNAIIPSTTGYLTAGNPSSSAEINRQLAMPACVVRNMRINLSATSPAAGTVVITLRKNGVDTALTVTITAGTVVSVVSDLTHSVTFAAGDLLSFSVTNNDASNNFVAGSSITFVVVLT